MPKCYINAKKCPIWPQHETDHTIGISSLRGNLSLSSAEIPTSQPFCEKSQYFEIVGTNQS